MRLATCAVFIFPFVLLAQSPLRWFVHAGVNYTRMNDPLGTGHGPYAGHGADGVGGVVGASAEGALGGPWSIVAEESLTLRRTGYRFDEGQKAYPAYMLADGTDRGYRTTNSTYAQTAGLLAYRGFPGLRLEGGLYAARLIRACDVRNGERLLQGTWEELHDRTDITASLEPWDLGWAIGAQVEGPQRVHAQLRYVASLFNMDRGKDSSPSMASGVQVCVVYGLGSKASKNEY